MTDRHSYQQTVERLLDEISTDVWTLRRMKTFGVPGGALARQKREQDDAADQVSDFHTVATSLETSSPSSEGRVVGPRRRTDQ